MSVLIETTIGDVELELDYENYAIECYNFLKLCEIHFYDYQCFYDLKTGNSIRIGDALIGFRDRKEFRTHNTAIEGIHMSSNSIDVMPELIEPTKGAVIQRMVQMGQVAFNPTISGKHDCPLIGSQIIMFLNEVEKNTQELSPFARVLPRSLAVLEELNQFEVDKNLRPLSDIRVKKTHIIFDPFPLLNGSCDWELSLPVQDIRLPKEWLETHKTDCTPQAQIIKDIKRKELTLEIVDEMPTMGIRPSEHVLFVCKLNPLTRAKDIATIFRRFGEVLSVEIVRDKNSGLSLGYGFVEFQDVKACEQAYKKMEGVLIDDRRIHVDFSQSVKKNSK